MALQVWLPLNGTLENKGLSNITVTNNGATVNNNGKIGKCYSTNGTYLVANNPITSANTNLTITGWVYLNSGNYAYIYSCRTGTGGPGLFISLETGCSIFDDGTRWSTTYKIPLNTWVHFAFTRNNNGKKLYINGELHSSTTTLGNMSGIHTKMYLGRNFYGDTASTSSDMKMNDFRIYDHCLSAKEVKEISKGLILHYKLDGNDIGITIPRNGGLIPDGVELYDYIQSNGTQYLDSGIVANQYPIELKTNLCYTDNATSEKDFFGNFSGGNSSTCFVCGKANSNKFYQWGGSVFFAGSVVQNQFYELSFNYTGASGRTLTIDGTANTSTANNGFISRTDTIGIFSGASTRAYCAASVKMKYAQIKINNVVVRNFIPCTYLGEPGMWDTVENKFYRNQGTGQFTLGNKITLKEYEYLSATKGPYINTGYCHSATTSIDLDAAFNTLYSYNTLLGAATSDNSSDSFCFGTKANGGLNCDLTRGFNVISGTAGKLTAGTRFNVKLDVTKAILNGVTYTTGVTTGRACQYAMAIFGRNLSNSYSSEIGDGKVYELKIYDSPGVLVRDFIPVSYNGTPGLWDKVEWKFYGNAGSGNFTLGPEKTVQQDAPIFYDSSGYCNHGSITGTFQVSNDSSRYINSCLFSATESNYIRTPSQCLVGPYSSQALTFSFWINPQQKGNRHMIFGSASNYALNIEFTAANALRIYLNSSPDYYSFTCNNNEWTHVVIVITTNIKCYKNGVLQGTSGAASWPGFSGDMLIGSDTRIGTYFLGSKMSDFRIYATALSEDDIKELYNTSAFVTNNGVFAEYELYEDNLSDVKKRGLLETANFYENGAESEYALDTDKTRVASNYIISEDFIEI